MSGHRFLKYICLATISVLLIACGNNASYSDRQSLASVGDSHLYKDELDIIYAQQGYVTDSATFVQGYIERWIVDMLFYEKAKENVASTEEIDMMVESYRKSLIENVYQDRLITQQLVPDISDEDVQEFYEKERALFELSEPYIKGFYVKIPVKAPKVRNVRNWCIRKGQDDLEELEKLCSENRYEYQFFMEEWTPFAELVRKMPLTEYQLMTRLTRKSTIEFTEGKFVYFVCADSILQKDDTKPIEMVSDEIKELLLNSKKADFIKTVKRSLYEEALKSGRAVLHYGDESDEK